MTQAKELILETIKSIETLRIQTSSPVHAIIYGAWGTGKSYSVQEIAGKSQNVFYVKIPDGAISKSRLLKLLALALGSGYRHLYEGTLDLMKYHILHKGLAHPIFILDEAQRVLKNSLLMSELKDLSEDPALNFSYVFLGDTTVPQVYTSHPHSLHKRILIKKQIEPLTEKTIKHLVKHYNLPDNEDFIKLIATIGKELSWTTINIAFLFSYLKPLIKKGQIKTIDKKTILKIAEKLGMWGEEK